MGPTKEWTYLALSPAVAKVLGTALAESAAAVLVVGVPVTVTLPALKYTYIWQSRFSVKMRI